MLHAIEHLETRQCLAQLAFSSFELLDSVDTAGGDVQVADIDNDGHLDVAFSGNDDEETQILFGSNTSDRLFISEDNSDDLNRLDLLDFDSDGDLDLITNEFVYENFGNRNFSGNDDRQSLIDGKKPLSRDLGDVDGDGDSDLIIADGYGETYLLAWLENDGSPDWIYGNNVDDFSVLLSGFSASSVNLVDIDGDGNGDVVARGKNELVWVKGLGNGEFDSSFTTTSSEIGFTPWGTFSDLNKDGFLDFVNLEGNDDTPLTMAWYAGSESGFEPQGLAYDFGSEGLRVWRGAMDVGDLDGDGDEDIVAVTFASAGDDLGTQIHWLENSNGSFERHKISNDEVTSWDGGIRLFDYNGDDKLDIVGVDTIRRRPDSMVALIQELPGDANGDGRFDSSDLVHIFQRGQYEDGIAKNSRYSDGDWNFDDEFTSADLVFALQAGNYEVAPASVPTASTPSQNIAAAVDFVFGESDKKRSAFVA